MDGDLPSDISLAEGRTLYGGSSGGDSGSSIDNVRVRSRTGSGILSILGTPSYGILPAGGCEWWRARVAAPGR